MRLGPKSNRPDRNSQAFTNRADEVRSRRAQRSQQRASSVSSRIVNPPPSRPVIVRNGTFGRPIHQQASTRARRQFYVTMDRSAGTELRLPAIPVIRPGWRLASSLLAILMAIGIFSLWNSPFCQISTVEVSGLQRLTSAEVNAVLKLENLSIVEVDADQVKDQLYKAFPELLNVSVGVEMPNAVMVSATERQPVLAVVKGDQKNWVDASGVIFPARGDAGKLVTLQANDNLPLAITLPDPAQVATQDANSVEGNNAPSLLPVKNPNPVPVTGPQKIDPTLLAAVLGLSKKLPEGTQLVYSSQNGLGWQAPEGWQVFIGNDLADFEAKYAMYQHIASDLANQGVKPALISVENLDAPFYRLEQ